MRQSPHLSDEHLSLFFTKFQLDVEAGLGSESGRLSPWGEIEEESLSPQIMLQWSDDGGHTWSEEHWVSAGQLGRYKHRAIWWRLGRGRNRTWRVVVTEPIAWRFIDAFVDAMRGTA